VNGFLEQMFGSFGEVTEVFTMVDFYQYIKGVEYLICVGFFILFPMFYKYIHRVPQEPERK
jgi:hypothetical protein